MALSWQGNCDARGDASVVGYLWQGLAVLEDMFLYSPRSRMEAGMKKTGTFERAYFIRIEMHLSQKTQGLQRGLLVIFGKKVRFAATASVLF